VRQAEYYRASRVCPHRWGTGRVSNLRSWTPGCNESDDRANRDPEAANARFASHDVRIECDRCKLFHRCPAFAPL